MILDSEPSVDCIDLITMGGYFLDSERSEQIFIAVCEDNF